MKYNTLNLQEGEHCILDEGFANSSEVIIDKFTPKQLFAVIYSVTDRSDKWQVMTYRLSKINSNEQQKSQKAT